MSLTLEQEHPPCVWSIRAAGCVGLASGGKIERCRVAS